MDDIKPIFGGARSWDVLYWTSSDDRVRGGSSVSHLRYCPDQTTVEFYGNLDIDTLGGAGFASQRTASDDLCVDLSDYQGLELVIACADSKRYTINLKDTILPPSTNGREQAAISWEYSFNAQVPSGSGKPMLCRIPWRRFVPTYRGKNVEDAAPLDIANIKRFGIMIRSGFGQQQGDFDLKLKSIAAYKGDSVEYLRRLWPKDAKKPFPEQDFRDDLMPRPNMSPSGCGFPYPYRDYPDYKVQQSIDEKQGVDDETTVSEPRPWLSRFCHC